MYQIINRHEFHYFLSMADDVPYHMRFVVAASFHHHATDLRASTIFTSPYITRFIRGMGLLKCVHRMTIVGGYNPITFCSLQKLGISTPLTFAPSHPLYDPHLLNVFNELILCSCRSPLLFGSWDRVCSVL